jgi:hypothetical protein
METIEQPDVALGNRRLVSGSFNATMASVLVTIRDIMCLRGFETLQLYSQMQELPSSIRSGGWVVILKP